MSEYAYWRQYGPDLTSLGVIRGTIDPDNRYFCTPVGAIVFGWTGVDGIHFCKIRRFREMIFAVSPANAPGEYVHPIARDFRDFLRLLITLGDANLLEQAWMWDRSRFMTERKIVAAEEDPERDGVIRRLIKKFSLTPMEDPYGYIHSLQDRFDYTAIPYDPAFSEECLPQPSPAEMPWHVVCAPGFFPRTTRQQRSTEYPVRIPFVMKIFDGEPVDAQILSYYICHTGIVIDLFLETDDPTRSIRPTLSANKRTIYNYSGCACTNIPYANDEETEIDSEAAAVFAHYGLSDRRGLIQRFCFLWKDGGWHQEPALKSCVLTLCWEPRFRDIVSFTVRSAGEVVTFSDFSGISHTLTVVDWEAQNVPIPAYNPLYTLAMRYIIDPPLAKAQYVLADVSKFDEDAVQLSLGKSIRDDMSATAIGIIGGADGPTAILMASNVPDTTFSRVRAQPFDSADWCLRLLEPESTPVSIVLLAPKKEARS